MTDLVLRQGCCLGKGGALSLFDRIVGKAQRYVLKSGQNRQMHLTQLAALDQIQHFRVAPHLFRGELGVG